MLAVLFVVLSALSAFAAERHSTVINNNRTMTLGEFDFEVWRQREDANMTIYSDGTFECFWTRENRNILYRSGKRFNRNQRHTELGEIYLTFDVDYDADGNSSLCVYGWTVGPQDDQYSILRELYIVESWVSYRPTGGDHMGTVEIDGSVYDVFVQKQSGGNILGTTGEFYQYRNVRQDLRTSGTVSVSEHFRAWEELGLELGYMNDIMLCVTGFNSAGSAKVNEIVLQLGDRKIGGEPEPEPEAEPNEPGEANGDEPGEAPEAPEAPAPQGGGAPQPDNDDSGPGMVGLVIGVPAFGAFCGFVVTRKPKRY
jgi:endo-1,4-beta-xylanase